LKSLYVSVEDIDLYVGGLSERHVPDGFVGPTFACIIGSQFERYKFGDRYFYEHGGMYSSFTEEQLALIRRTSLAGMMCNVYPKASAYQLQPLPMKLPE